MLLGVSLAVLVPVSILNVNCLLALLLREKEVLMLRQSGSCLAAFSKLNVEISKNVSLGACYCSLELLIFYRVIQDQFLGLPDLAEYIFQEP